MTRQKKTNASHSGQSGMAGHNKNKPEMLIKLKFYFSFQKRPRIVGNWFIRIYISVRTCSTLKLNRGGYSGGVGDIRPLDRFRDFEAKNVPNLINVIVNDKFRIRNL